MKLDKSLKNKLIEQSLKGKLKRNEQLAGKGLGLSFDAADDRARYTDFRSHPAYKQIEIMREGSASLGIEDPFFRLHEGCSGATAVIGGKTYVNYASYNYLGLAGHPEVIKASAEAAARYGTSVSASRIVSGERPVHQQLERELAALYQADDALALVSGHATNVSVIGYLMGPKDLVLHDEYIHNSSLVGAQLSGARRMPFKHNSVEALEQLLVQHRGQFERVLIVTEGLFSMDGDVPDLRAMVNLKQRHQAWLMVDEAHALGVLGEKGLGSFELTGVNPTDVDIWMGTLSKTLSGCGGYIAGVQPLIDILRNLAPGFLYSVGMPAPTAAASLQALQIFLREPERVSRNQRNSEVFLQRARALGLDTGSSVGRAVVPVILGGSVKAARLSAELFRNGINVQPILYPAVPEKSARLRFFISSEHTDSQLTETCAVLQAYMD
ncbi:MAG: aminotransferase class I/II-fold pyridoxal phosphate-dependent enzyme [Gammaproteobacteria bacterium]|uniref:aminotransferase class I/II-fold pyridoxal phosphate-dependent enzyme n=1 Tax=Pseudomaricurvus alcaniphilus TaxID=1166482 RepID=UPI0014084C69|nr:aminotransferase class I/II-fold pyridoxal phosphate-dependent enzyme [Pseudomaricurvus alcaniphilus]MBR9911242.1 aminotransferase class I/II-fold pyridoxal phosphate-dependent enzyme [Gammaproteobacteria bacterium]NHN37623.1 aminotransferase class I/II-fold pyridoxal phosphate-dependent enzyme [Pseudomaricurvus alcaniphilus]